MWLTSQQMDFGEVVKRSRDKQNREVIHYKDVTVRILESTCEFGTIVNGKFCACECNRDRIDDYEDKTLCDHSSYIIFKVNIWKSGVDIE